MPSVQGRETDTVLRYARQELTFECVLPTVRSLVACFALRTVLSAQPVLTIALYDSAGLPMKTREVAKTEVARILLAAGISIEWVECEIGGQILRTSACAIPMGPTRFMLQLLPGHNLKSSRTSGMAIRQDGRSVYACVYTERIRELSREANWDFGDLLGHAAAHEIGHLLLETPSHSTAGLMRTRWETEDLRRLSHNGLTFFKGQLAAARARLERVSSATRAGSDLGSPDPPSGLRADSASPDTDQRLVP